MTDTSTRMLERHAAAWSSWGGWIGRHPAAKGLLAPLLAFALVAGAAPAEGATAPLRIAYFNNYLPAELEAQILGLLAERNPSLGVEHATLIGSDVTPAWVGLGRGDTDVLVEVDLPNQQPLLDKAAPVASAVGQIYADAGEGFFVPRYVIEGPGAAAPALRRVDQLAAYGQLFHGVLYDESPGWQSTKDNALRLKSFAIPLRQVPLADAALTATVLRAADRHEPVVFFFAHPHWLFKRIELAKLDEPATYHPGCFQNGDDRCAVPSFSAFIAARRDFAGQAPKYVRLLSRVRIPIDQIESMMFDVTIGKKSTREVAAAWLDDHRELVGGWVRSAIAE